MPPHRETMSASGSWQAGREIVRRWPALLPPGIIVHALVVGLRLPFLAASGMAGAIGGVFRGWGGIVLILLALPPVFGLALALPTLVGLAFVSVMASDALAGRPPSLRHALQVVAARLPGLLGMLSAEIVVVSYGLFFFVVPGLIAATALVFALPALLFEDADPMGALRRSVGLTARHPGRSLGLGFGLWVWLAVLFLAAGLAVQGAPVVGIGLGGASGVAMVYWSVTVMHVYRALTGRSEERGR